MNFIMRGLVFSTRNTSNKLYLVILVFIFIFVASSFLLYSSVKESVDLLKKTVTNCVTVKGIELTAADPALGLTVVDIQPELVKTIADDPRVDFYNCAKFTHVNFTESYKKIFVTYSSLAYEENRSDALLYAPLYSEFDAAFTLNGYQLIAGEHFTEKEGGKQICLISERFAQLNGLELGDKLNMQQKNQQKSFSLTISGIFRSPLYGEYIEGYEESPDETIFIPLETLNKLSEKTAKKGFITISVYMNRAEDIDEYVDELKKRVNVLKVYKSSYDYSAIPVAEEAKELSFQELAEFYEENHYINLMLDQQWYEMTAGPLEHVVNLCGYLVLGLMTAVLIILSLASVLSVRKRLREFGILLAMGESRAKLMAQILIEQIIPMAVAALLGVALGVAVGIPLVGSVGQTMYQSRAVVTQALNGAKSQEYIERSVIGAGDRGYNHPGSTDLIFKSANRINCMPMISPKVSAGPILIFFLAVLLMTALAICIQIFFILRLKPAQILTRR